MLSRFVDVAPVFTFLPQEVMVVEALWYSSPARTEQVQLPFVNVVVILQQHSSTPLLHPLRQSALETAAAGSDNALAGDKS